MELRHRMYMFRFLPWKMGIENLDEATQDLAVFQLLVHNLTYPQSHFEDS